MPFETDLSSGYPFWAVRNGLLHAFPPLREDHRCDVVVLGGGISGALIADELVEHGHEVAIVEQHEIGWGSTAASTALLQYEIDTHLVELCRRYGEDDALLAYRACLQAITQLQAKAAGLGEVDFRLQHSLYYASRRRDRDTLRDEHALRARHGFPVDWLEPAELRAQYGIDAPGAILSRLAAVVDPYRMTYQLLMRLQRHGAAVFDRSTIARIEPTPRGVTLHAASGLRIRARHAVLAAGYDSQRWLTQKVARNSSSYACVSDPVDADLGPLQHTMLWESARPYLYLRSTGDGRLILGGEDDAIDRPARRDARVVGKAQTLMRKFHRLLPQLPFVPAFAWAGTFAETEDGLPFFGPHEEYGPRVHFAMAYGGNGTTYSMLGAGLIRALIERRKHPLAALFSFARLER